ncbi:FAD-binding oxidoreductase, partial [Acinetobacter baumannii]
PDLTVHDARAEVLTVRRQTPRSITITLRPNAAWSGARAGQFVRVGIEIDGVRRTRTYSPATSQHARDGLIELTVTRHPAG